MIRRVRLAAWATSTSLGSRGRGPGRPRRRLDARTYQRAAQRHMQRLRQGGAFAIAMAALLLLVWGAPVDGQDAGSTTETAISAPAAPTRATWHTPPV